MRTTLTATATATTEPPRGRSAGAVVFHLALAGWVLGMIALAELSFEEYRQLVQEDHFVEWWTAALFAAAGWLHLKGALPPRRWLDLLVALFCLFVAGEEFSWGQRLLGFTPPAGFLEHNAQQELTLHNFSEWFGKPKGVLTLALLAYGGLLPLMARARGGRLLARWGATPPPLATVPWFLLAAWLLHWYPVEFTGEWVEALAGGLFLATATRSPGHRLRFAGGAAIAATLLSAVSGSGRGASPAALACASAEAESLLREIVSGHAATDRLLRAASIHKRVWTAVEEGYLRSDAMGSLAAVGCPGEPGGGRRAAHALDPWGMPYWVRVEDAQEGHRGVVVYSTGPNRRRDGRPGDGGGDDIPAIGELARP